MKAYRYTAYSDAGRLKKGVIVAETESHASDLLKAQGLFASQLTAKPPRRNFFSRQKRHRLSEDVRAVFTRQLAVLLSAELPVEAALEAVRTSGSSAAVVDFAADVKAAVLDGAPLSESISKSNAGFPRYYIAAIKAGETSGDVSQVFDLLADHLERLGTSRATLATALIYPAFVASVSLLVASFLMVNVAPEIVSMFEISDRPLPRITQIMLGISGFVQAHWKFLLAGVVAFVVGLSALLRVGWFRNRWDNFWLRVPVIGRLMRMAAAAQYLRTLALVIASRQNILDAVSSAAEVLSIQKYIDESDVVCEAVRSGESLSDALTQMSLIDPVVLQLVSIGEQSARLGSMTGRAADMVESNLDNRRKRLLSLLDPILMMIVGVFVLVIVLSILLPIFDLQSTIAR
ncbi:MAG: type II secretion system F family protein [Rhodobacteraceae bacterium]|nr:type II secretion system F family protein [Paracoccaceae bacterium]